MGPANHTEDPSSARVKSRVLVSAVVGAGIVFLDAGIVTVALPSIQRDLGMSTTAEQWVASAYLLTLSSLLLVGGRLADVLGRTRMFRSGLAAYVLLSGAASLSPNAAFLVGVRALQGVAAAVLVPTTLALINSAYEPGERGRAIGRWAAWSGVATIAGPVLAGWIIDRASWRWALLITPLLALFALLLSRPLPEWRDDSAERRVDFAGVLLVCLGMGALVFALVQGPVSGWTSATVVTAGVLAAVLLLGFLGWERRAAIPLMPLEMFRARDLVVANAVTFFVYAGLYGTFFYVPLYVQTALSVPAAFAGGLFVPVTVSLFLLSPLAGRLDDRYGPRWPMSFGPLAAAAGLGLIGLTGPRGVWTVLLPGILLLGVGLGFTVAPITVTAIGSAETRYSGIASGFNNAVSRIAGLFAIALMGAVAIHTWQTGIISAQAVAPPRVASALESVRDRAFVVPKVRGLSASEEARVRSAAAQAASRSFASCMSLAAILVAIGGVVSALFIGQGRRQPADHSRER